MKATKENKNKNMSESYRANYCQESEPSLGATVPKSKKARIADNTESGKAYPGTQKPEKVREAVEVPHVVKAAHQSQNGKNQKFANIYCWF
jgi:hypothetical protein